MTHPNKPWWETVGRPAKLWDFDGRPTSSKQIQMATGLSQPVVDRKLAKGVRTTRRLLAEFRPRRKRG